MSGNAHINFEEEVPEEIQRLLIGQRAVMHIEGMVVNKHEHEEGGSVGMQVISVVLESVKGDGTDMALEDAKKRSIDFIRTQGTGG